MLPLGLPVDYCLRKVPFFSSTASMDSWRAPLGFIFSFLRRRLSLVVAHRKETESAFSSLHAHRQMDEAKTFIIFYPVIGKI